MAAGVPHQFDMAPISGKAYGSHPQWISNQMTHDWEKTHWTWEGPIEGNPNEKFQEFVGPTIDMTPTIGNDWYNYTTYIPIPDTAYTNTQMNRLAKHCELTNITVRALVILPHEPAISGIDVSETPDMAVLRMNVIMRTSGQTLPGPAQGQQLYSDATQADATWRALGFSYGGETEIRRLYDNKVFLKQGNLRMESCDGVPESGSASITNTTYSAAGDMKIVQWGMRDMALLQKYSSTNSGQTGTVWNGIIIKWAAKYMGRRSIIKKGLAIQWMTQFSFLDRLGIGPVPGLYLDRFGQIRAATGPGTNSRQVKHQASTMRSRKKARPMWDDDANDYGSSIFGPALQ